MIDWINIGIVCAPAGFFGALCIVSKTFAETRWLAIPMVSGLIAGVVLLTAPRVDLLVFVIPMLATWVADFGWRLVRPNTGKLAGSIGQHMYGLAKAYLIAAGVGAVFASLRWIWLALIGSI